ncbi:aconitase X swivel domain-containing protein [Nitratireductor arenosus]
MSAKGDVLVAGMPGRGPALVLQAPISFWGGVDPRDGRIIDGRHPQYGAAVAMKVLFVPATIGSSSASSVLLELVRGGVAPAALIIGEPDAILLLGLIVAREMGWEPPIAVRLDPEHFSAFCGRTVEVGSDGTLDILEGGSGQ